MPEEPAKDGAQPSINDKPMQEIVRKLTADEPTFTGPVDAEVEPATNTNATIASGPTQPTSTSAAMDSALNDPVTPTPLPAQGKSKKKLFIAGGAALAVAALIGGSALAYNVWYQNPDKVLDDAIGNAMMAKSATTNGTMNFATKGTNGQKATITFDTKHTRSAVQINLDAKSDYGGGMSLNAGFIYDNKADIYIKLAGLKKIVTAMGPVDSGVLPMLYSTLGEKIDGKWVVITSEDMKKFSPGTSKQTTCTSEVMKKTESDTSYFKEIAKLYQSNRFVVVKQKLASKNGSLGYLIELDDAKSKNFSKALQQAKLMKELDACDPQKNNGSSVKGGVSEQSFDKSKQPRMEVWVDRWSHQLTGVKISQNEGDQSVAFDVSTKMNAPVTITSPSGAITIDNLMKDFEGMMGEPSSMTSSTMER